MNPAKVLISAILMPVMAIPAIAQKQQYLMKTAAQIILYAIRVGSMTISSS